MRLLPDFIVTALLKPCEGDLISKEPVQDVATGFQKNQSLRVRGGPRIPSLQQHGLCCEPSTLL